MNIAITSLYLPSGSKIGVGYQVHHLANALVQRGHAVTVFSQTGSSPGARYETVAAPVRRHTRTFRFAWDLRRYDFAAFDVLNAHGDDWFLWGRRRPRHVHTYHGSCLAEMFHARSFAGKARMAALAACEFNSLLLADDTVAVSENTRRYFPRIRHVIPCGVDTEAFSPGNGKKSAPPAILFVGTMHGRKRGRLLLEIFRREIRPAMPEAELWCVCDRPDDEREGGGVRWLGRVDHETLVDLYRRAWVFCLPSTYEGFGVPYIEAMASGLPVVATPNVGAREVTREGLDGVLAPDELLGARLLGLLQDPDARALWVGRGLARAQDFSWERVCRCYEEVYQR